MNYIKFNLKGKFTAFLLIFTILLTFFNFGCNSGNNVLNFNYFNTNIHIESYSTKINDTTKERIDLLLKNLESELSLDNENSFVYKFNNLKKDESLEKNETFIKLYKKSLELYELTSGKFDITLLPLSILWNLSSDTYNDGLRQFSIPSKDKIEETKLNCGLNNVIKLDNNGSICKLNENGKIDLGGIAKGYATDEIVKVLQENNIVDGYISMGSSSMYIFNVNSLSIRHPRKTENLPNIISINSDYVTNVSISTSGDYERYFEIDNKRYCHIIDSDSGSPIDTGILSATIICRNNMNIDGTYIDGLSTAMMTYNYEIDNHSNCELTKFLNRLDNGIEYFIVYSKNDNNLILTNIEQSNFTLLDNTFTIKNI